ncbi:hypothetical protein H4R33_006741, partial [Dimargaris cristalligena]
ATFGIDVIELELEGHGRRARDSTIDISRTVGWFTSIYPALFDLHQTHAYSKDSNNLRALAIAKQRRFEQLEAEDAFWRPRHIEMGWADYWNKDELFNRALSVACDYSSSEGLVLSVMYSSVLHRSSTIQRLVNQWRTSLEELILECNANPTLSIVTASDFTSASLTELDFSKLVQDDLPSLNLTLAEIEDIYPCLPVQEGLLFATLQDPAAYMVQLGFTINGQLNVGRFHRAWDQTAHDHSILRTHFLTASGCHADKNLQVITKNFDAHWTIRSWEGCQTDDLCEQFFLQERSSGFSLGRPWIQFGLFRMAPNIHKLLISVHHALLDVTYRDFVGHILELSNNEVEQFWTHQFAGVEEPSILVQAHHHPALLNMQPSDAEFYGSVELALGSNPSVGDILQAVYATSTQAHGFEHCRLTDIHRWSGLGQERPLFNTLLVLENYPENSENPDLPFQMELDSFWDPTDFPLAIIAHTQGNELQFRITYRSLDFSPNFIDYFADHYITALSSLVAVDASSPLTDIQILTVPEREQLLGSWATNPRDTPRALAHDLFKQQCESAPRLTALAYNSRQYTYAQLDTAANRLAHSLALKAPCGSDQIVALIADNCPELVVGQLAIWKTGCAFVILAPDYPLERYQLILEDTKAIAVMGKPSCLSILNGLGRDIPLIPINIAALFADGPTSVYPSPAIDPSHLAAIIYTSGSTGTPKGVMHEHRALANHWQGMGSVTNTNPGAITPTLVTPTFDVSLSEIWTTLSFGGTLLVAQGEYESALSQATRACCTPSLLSSFDPANFPNLRQVIITGEPANQGIVNKWANQVELINWYGPTEVACGSHWTLLQSNSPVIPIGTPLPNATGIILDTQLRPVPIGGIGQLYLGGRGVARGYLNRPELTQEKFILSPFTGERIYQSGDLARWLPNGQIECLGRIDNQVKLRGFRIELGEIESALELYPVVDQACVIVQDENHLVGYIVPPSGRAVSILDSLRSRLPHYMIPSVLVELTELPRTRVGKIDRKALPKHKFCTGYNNHEAAQVNPAEARLIGLIAETLRIDSTDISPSATFFQLGGNSLSAIQLVSRCRRQNLHLALVDISRTNSITHLAEITLTPSDSIEVFAEDNQDTADSESGVVRLTPPQLELFALQLVDPHFFPLSTMFESRVRFTAQQWQTAWNKVVQRHDMLRARFQSLNGEIMTIFAELDDPSSTCFEYLRLDDIRDALTQLNEINHRMNFETGPISQVRVFDARDVQYVYISVHHLVFDYMSVQIVREDLSTFITGQNIESMTLSHKAWADHLWSLAQSIEPGSIIFPSSVAPLPLELPANAMPITNETRERVVDRVDQSATHHLMITVANRFGATPIELILTTLVCAYNRHFGLSKIDIGYVGHGRKDPLGQCDVSRTVGFFACQFPLVFECASNGDLVDTLRSVQAKLSAAVDNGFLYTVAKNLHIFSDDQRGLKKQFDVQPQFGFTYLDDMAARDSSSMNTLLIERPTMLNDLRTSKSRNKYPFVLDFSAWNTTAGLELITNFNSKQFQMDTISGLTLHWKECILELSRI